MIVSIRYESTCYENSVTAQGRRTGADLCRAGNNEDLNDSTVPHRALCHDWPPAIYHTCYIYVNSCIRPPFSLCVSRLPLSLLKCLFVSPTAPAFPWHIIAVGLSPSTTSAHACQRKPCGDERLVWQGVTRAGNPSNASLIAGIFPFHHRHYFFSS